MTNKSVTHSIPEPPTTTKLSLAGSKRTRCLVLPEDIERIQLMTLGCEFLCGSAVVTAGCLNVPCGLLCEALGEAMRGSKQTKWEKENARWVAHLKELGDGKNGSGRLPTNV
jgi:hypothetical protein